MLTLFFIRCLLESCCLLIVYDHQVWMTEHNCCLLLLPEHDHCILIPMLVFRSWMSFRIIFSPQENIFSVIFPLSSRGKFGWNSVSQKDLSSMIFTAFIRACEKSFCSIEIISPLGSSSVSFQFLTPFLLTVFRDARGANLRHGERIHKFLHITFTCILRNYLSGSSCINVVEKERILKWKNRTEFVKNKMLL